MERVYYKDCYGTFTSSMHLKCTEDDASTSTNEHPSQGLRSKFGPLNTDLCVFCQQQSRARTRLVASLSFFIKATTSCLKGQCIECRLACVNDLVAGDVCYHLKCYVKFIRKSDSDPYPMKQPNHKALCLK